MFENLILQIQDYGWLSIVVGLGAAFIFYFLGKKTSEKHSENLKNTQTTVTESQETINKINGHGRDVDRFSNKR